MNIQFQRGTNYNYLKKIQSNENHNIIFNKKINIQINEKKMNFKDTIQSPLNFDPYKDLCSLQQTPSKVRFPSKESHCYIDNLIDFID